MFVGMFVGVLAYADDVVLLDPSANAMRKMLRLCDDFASDYDVKFNPFSPAHCSRTDLTDPAHTKCVLKMNTFV